MGIPRPTGSPTTKRQRRPRQDGGVGRDARPSDVRGVDEERPDHLTLSLGGARRPGRRRNTGGHRRELELQRAGRAQRERGEDPAEHHDFVMAPDAGIQSFLRVLDVDAGPPPPLPPYFLSILAHDVPNLQTSMPPGSVRDLMSALASNAGVPQDAQDANANTNPFLRVLREAERVMGGPPGDEEEERQQRTGRPGRPGRSEQTRQPESPRRVTFRPPPDNDNENNNNNTERTETIPAVVAELASNAAMRIQCLVRSVMRRVEERRAFPDEVSRTRQIVEILLGIRSGFSDAASNDNAASRSPLDMSRVEMENMLIQMRIDHPEWRENAGQDAGADDLMLQNFHKAIEDGDLVGMLQCIPRMRHPISHRDVAGETALHVACLHGREEEVQLLLDMGHTADPCCLDGSTPLADAASGGFANLVALLCMRTPHCINMVDVDGDGPLHNAARGEYGDVIRLLLEVGADTECRNSDGDRPIDFTTEGSRCHRLLSSRLAGVEGKDREVLRLFSLYRSHDVDNEGFSVVDLIALSNNRLGPDHIFSSLHRLVALGALVERGTGNHWAMVDSVTMADLGLTWE